MKTSYRPDIDGLRAVAVLAVLAYHIMPAIARGGFVGVDVFFVISGYLIAGILWRDLDAGRLSLASFYERRIRRLLPALVAVVLVSAGLLMAIGLPDEVRSFGWSALTSAMYVSNHYFLSQTGYFDDSAEVNPLLHTWSLSVEEQFYLVFPLLLLLIHRHARRWSWAVLGGIALASLVLSEVLVQIRPETAFYILPARFWELALGGCLALRPLRLPAGWRSESVAWIGMGCIAGATVLFSEATPFPGLMGLLPVLGAAMLLVSGETAKGMGGLLSLPPVRFIGKISYSVYLWHWPLVVFYKLQVSPEPSSMERVALVVASLVLGALSWRFIEQPFRLGLPGASAARVFWRAGLATVSIALLGAVLVWTDGGQSRFSAAQLRFIEFLSYNADPLFRTGTCFLTSDTDDASYFDEKACLPQKPGPRVMIVGDSHAAQYYAAFAKHLPEVQIAQVTASGCRPTTQYAGEARCTELMRKAFEEYLVARRYDAVVLAGRWEMGDVDALPETVRLLQQHVQQVIVLGPIIEYSQAVPRLLARHAEGDDDIEQAQLFEAVEAIDRRVEAVLLGTPATYYSILHTLCEGRHCQMLTSNGKPLQFDSSHLTYQGAYDVVGALIHQGMFWDGLHTPRGR